MNEEERTLDEVLDELGECTLEWSNHKVALKDSFSELLGEARTIGGRLLRNWNGADGVIGGLRDELTEKNEQICNMGEIINALRDANGSRETGEQGKTMSDKKTTVDGRTLDEVLDDIAANIAEAMLSTVQEARTIGEKMQAEINRLKKYNHEHEGTYVDKHEFNQGDIRAVCGASVHDMLLRDGNYISFPVVISGTKRGDVKIPVIGCGVTEQGKYITLKLGSLSFRLPIDFDADKLGG